jgi:hypothetical protein
MTTIEEIGRRLKLLCEQLRFVEAYETLYSTDAVSIDPMNQEHGELKGLDALIESEKKFLAHTNVHRFVASEPLIAGSYISFRFFMDITMDGRNIHLSEIAVYNTKDGKIISQQFFPGGLTLVEESELEGAPFEPTY